MMKKFRWPFVWTSTSPPSSPMPTPQSTKASSPWILYQDCRVTLEVFLTCLFDKDFSGLIISGIPPHTALMEAWNKIYLEYHQLTTGTSDSPMTDKIKLIEGLNGKVILIEAAVRHLAMTWDEEVVKMLNFFGMRCDLKPDDSTEIMYRKLNSILTRAKRFVVQSEVEQQALQELQTEAAKDGGNGRDDFEETLLSCSKFQGYAVKPNEITVAAFCKLQKRMMDTYNREIKSLNHA
jgi:hypothetical protein